MTLERYPSPGMEENAYVLFDEGSGDCLVVDPGEADSPAIARAAALGGVKYILLTHGHFDHILGAAACRRQTGGKLVIHAADVPMLSDPGLSLTARFFGPEAQEPCAPDITVGEGDRLPFGQGEIRVLHTPGHTPGSVCYAVGTWLFTGDTLFAGSIGRTDFPGGSIAQMRRSLARLAALEGDATLLPGHGPQTTLLRERATNPYLTDWIGENDEAVFDR